MTHTFRQQEAAKRCARQLRLETGEYHAVKFSDALQMWRVDQPTIPAPRGARYAIPGD